MKFNINFNNGYEVVKEFDFLEEAKEYTKDIASYLDTNIIISDNETGEILDTAIFYGMPIENAQAECDDEIEVFLDWGLKGFHSWSNR